MRKRMIIMIIALIVVFGGIFGWKAFVNFQIDKFLANRQAPPVTVATDKVKKDSWTPALTSTGSLRAIQGVDVTTEVPGTVAKIAFESGQDVSEGDLLIALDASTEKAELEGLRAQGELARQTLERKRNLSKRGVGSKADLDQAQATRQERVASAQAKQAMINKKTIRAPFAGTVGLRMVDQGQYLAPGTAVVTLQALDPIYLDFSLPQQQLHQVRTGQTVSLNLQGQQDEQVEGKIIAISPKIEAGTRSFSVRAQIENAERHLRPGMFGQVSVVLNESRDVLTVPQTAISYNPYGDTVFRVVHESEQQQNNEESENKSEPGPKPEDGEAKPIARRVNVRLGKTRGDLVQVLSGIEAGDEVVVAGQLKLRGGDKLIIDNSIVPQSKRDPEPIQNY